MRILFLTNNKISYELYNWIKTKENEDVTLFEDRINIDFVRNFKPDIIISYNYKYIVKKEVIDYMKNKIVNLHISLLPCNKGASPNLWSFLEDTPKGVTIHLLDEGLDTGDILFQKKIYFDESKETLKSSYIKLHQEIQKLFKENWNKIKSDNLVPIPQVGAGSKHFIKDSNNIMSLIDSWDITILELKEIYKKSKGDL
ncbi:formyltransferase family protein [Clostridium omnivorum]|uniref:Formyl transferase N-terminal domain-containing protein n=1 Tax=Clostridium omnivorum TaxID=1604902 RepID=A0ABQ5NAQ4_9CLOT|nr:formyltransferase family protein [Clostridium sp. E14]GLC32339.1 hypothetical protein bsdE14_37490 [Clostridium sp. E14]